MKKKVTPEQLIELVLKESDNLECSFVVRESLKEQVHFYKLGQGNFIPPSWERFIPDLTEAELKSKSHPLQFDYCECGCHGFFGQSKGLGYWIINDLTGVTGSSQPASYHLFRGHGPYGVGLGAFKDMQEAEIAAQNDWDKQP